jgi:putative lipoprotein
MILVFAVLVACSRKPAADSASTRADSTPQAAPAAAPVAPTDSTPGAPLRGTDWRLVTLGEKAVPVIDSQRAPRITLQPDSKSIVASGGCNRMFGIYDLKGDAIRFSGIGSTRMACKSGMDTESAYLAALLRVARWRVNGQQLELSDSSGTVLARFEAKAR